MNTEVGERFAALAKAPEAPGGLARGALILAAEAKPGVEIDLCLAQIEALAESARPLVEAAETETAAVDRLNHVLFELEGFTGNREAYRDPRNSFLDEVLTSRRGLPITLSVLYVDIARRLGFEADGVGFPGHFLSKVSGLRDAEDGEIIVDPFFGRTLTAADCAQRLRAAMGDAGDEASAPVSFDRRWIAPASAADIYARMLNNLKLLYLTQGDAMGALGCFDRILLLVPDAAGEYRDRGLLLERMDCLLPAIEDMTRFLDLAPFDPSAAEIRRRRDALSLRKPALN